ncbi:nucleotidyltransferase domain-containing protein [Candidatus Micrarchaeota archaeon]|nr:nucleotidyltransferase domain-containing protein [Candidatus Micrarchaeota archaeon]
MDVENKLIKLKSSKDILAIYIFGSYVRGSMHSRSDIDICIIPNKKSEEEREDLELVADIAKDFPGNFDFVNFYRLPIQIQYRVFKEGKEVFSADEKLVSRIKFQILKEYLEMQPMLERMYAQVLAKGRKNKRA